MEVLMRLYEHEGVETAERERLEIATAIAQERLSQERMGNKG